MAERARPNDDRAMTDAKSRDQVPAFAAVCLYFLFGKKAFMSEELVSLHAQKHLRRYQPDAVLSRVGLTPRLVHTCEPYFSSIDSHDRLHHPERNA
jgi:hypothetical protein